MPIAPMNMVEVMGGLAALSGQQEQNKQQRIKTKEFLDTHNARVKRDNAQLMQQQQAAEMTTEAQSNLRDKGLHVTGTEAAARSSEQAAKTETKKNIQFSDFYDYNAINSVEDHKRAVLGRIAAGEDSNSIIADLGEFYDKEFIEARAAQAAVTPAMIAKREELRSLEQRTQTTTAASRANTKDQVYAQLAIASMQKNAAIQQARLSTMQNPYAVVNPDDIPDIPATAFVENIMAGNEKLNDVEVQTMSERAAAAYKATTVAAYQEWNNRVSAAANSGGTIPFPPQSENPGLHTNRYIEQALIQASNRNTTLGSIPGISDAIIEKFNKMKDTKDSLYWQYKAAHPNEPDLWLVQKLFGDLNAQ